MTCEEFRRSWLDAEGWDDAWAHGLEDGPLGGRGREPAWAAHHAACAACRAWLDAERALDGILGAALVVAPPPELTERLARIPSLAPVPGAVSVGALAWEMWVEVLFLVVVGLSAIGLGATGYAPAYNLILDRVGAMLQAVPLVLSAPLLGYLQGLALTVTEAMATLLLLAIGLYRLYPGGGSWAQTE